MNYTVSNVNGCTRKINFNFETLDLSTQLKSALQEKQKSANLKGFRKGKAPIAMVQKLFGPQIETEALNNFVQAQFFEAVKKENLKIVGYPTFENMKYEQGKSVSFEALVEVFPVFNLKDFSGLAFKKDKVEVNESDLEELKTNYLSSKSELRPVTDKGHELAKGNFAIINFQGEMPNGDKPENMKGADFSIEIGSNTFIPGFEDGLIGMKAGEKKLLEVEFPADYHMETLRSVRVKFEVEMLEVKEKILPEFTDEFAKEVGYESVEDFYSKNKEMMFERKEREAEQKLQHEMLEKLISDNKFDLPSSLLLKQEGYVKQDLTKNLKSQGFSDDMIAEYFDKWAGDITKKAEFQVRSGLILEKLAEQFKAEVSDADIDAKIQEMAKTSKIEVEKLKEYYLSNQEIKNNLYYSIREQKAFDGLKSKVKVS